MKHYSCFLQIGVSVLLFIFYNCYGQVITISEKRYARSREVAVKSVKESAQAQARWLAARDAFKKRAIELQSQVSRTFSGRITAGPIEKVRILNRTKGDTYGYLH